MWHEVSAQRRNQVFWGLVIIFASGLVLTFLFWQDIKEFLGHQTATVTQMTLDDKELKFKVEEFAKALVNELLYVHYFCLSLHTTATTKQGEMQKALLLRLSLLLFHSDIGQGNITLKTSKLVKSRSNF